MIAFPTESYEKILTKSCNASFKVQKNHYTATTNITTYLM